VARLAVRQGSSGREHVAEQQRRARARRPRRRRGWSTGPAGGAVDRCVEDLSDAHDDPHGVRRPGGRRRGAGRATRRRGGRCRRRCGLRLSTGRRGRPWRQRARQVRADGVRRRRRRRRRRRGPWGWERTANTISAAGGGRADTAETTWRPRRAASSVRAHAGGVAPPAGCRPAARCARGDPALVELAGRAHAGARDGVSRESRALTSGPVRVRASDAGLADRASDACRPRRACCGVHAAGEALLERARLLRPTATRRRRGLTTTPRASGEEEEGARPRGRVEQGAAATSWGLRGQPLVGSGGEVERRHAQTHQKARASGRHGARRARGRGPPRSTAAGRPTGPLRLSARPRAPTGQRRPRQRRRGRL
jgi:hypothetical protein